jgi:phosphatidylethanolamine N-methyltransferase
MGDILSTPAATEGDTATETDDFETELEMGPNRKKMVSPDPSSPPSTRCGYTYSRNLSRHDLYNKYFRRDTVLLLKLDPLRSVGSLHHLGSVI